MGGEKENVFLFSGIQNAFLLRESLFLCSFVLRNPRVNFLHAGERPIANSTFWVSCVCDNRYTDGSYNLLEQLRHQSKPTLVLDALTYYTYTKPSPHFKQ